MGAKLEIGVVIPPDWSLKYQVQGGRITDIQRHLSGLFPDYTINTGLVGRINEPLGVMQIIRSNEPNPKIDQDVLEEVEDAVREFYASALKPPN